MAIKMSKWLVTGLSLVAISILLSPSTSNRSMFRTVKAMSDRGGAGGGSGQQGPWNFWRGCGSSPDGSWQYSWGTGSGPGGSSWGFGSGWGGSGGGFGWGGSGSGGGSSGGMISMAGMVLAVLQTRQVNPGPMGNQGE
ncbi:uncharacterized protein LOC127808256 [Diospyros lotus]|uniref:uncharacterized protein LOC127808256 n=1 Tax=Diospyros lotus TaxID=55363 RepID=UPI00225290DB|nr:uncharacterized protein LOC127808256 [Diospyros lotus]